MRALICLLIVISVPGAAIAQVRVAAHPDQRSLLASEDPQLTANKKLIFDFWRVVISAHQVERAHEFMAEDYIQHAPMIATGREPFVQFFGRMPRRPVPDEIEGLVAIIAEGDLVSIFLKRECRKPHSPGETYTTTWFDMFRVENGVVVEHWDYAHLTAANNPPDCERVPLSDSNHVDYERRVGIQEQQT